MKKTNFGFWAALVLLFILAGMAFANTANGAAGLSQDPTPFLTATAPLPTCADYNVACFTATPEVPHAYPPPFLTPTPFSYPEPSSTNNEQTDTFTPSLAGLWAFLWD